MLPAGVLSVLALTRGRRQQALSPRKCLLSLEAEQASLSAFALPGLR